jgi:hypothetical protein
VPCVFSNAFTIAFTTSALREDVALCGAKHALLVAGPFSGLGPVYAATLPADIDHGELSAELRPVVGRGSGSLSQTFLDDVGWLESLAQQRKRLRP